MAQPQQEYDNSNSGALYVNERKVKDSHPDRSGSAEIVCPHCNRSFAVWLKGWLKKFKDGAKKGQTYLSMAFEAKEERQPSGGQQRPERPQQRGGGDDEEDMPF